MTRDLFRTMVDNLEGQGVDGDGWESPALILEFPDGEFNEAHGYLYSPDGLISAVAADPWAVRSAVDAYTSSRYRPGDAMPVQMLLQLDRRSGKYEVTFEDADETRWKMTPRNRTVFREGLRPAFDQPR